MRETSEKYTEVIRPCRERPPDRVTRKVLDDFSDRERGTQRFSWMTVVDKDVKYSKLTTPDEPWRHHAMRSTKYGLDGEEEEKEKVYAKSTIFIVDYVLLTSFNFL